MVGSIIQKCLYRGALIGMGLKILGIKPSGCCVNIMACGQQNSTSSWKSSSLEVIIDPHTNNIPSKKNGEICDFSTTGPLISGNDEDRSHTTLNRQGKSQLEKCHGLPSGTPHPTSWLHGPVTGSLASLLPNDSSLTRAKAISRTASWRSHASASCPAETPSAYTK